MQIERSHNWKINCVNSNGHKLTPSRVGLNYIYIYLKNEMYDNSNVFIVCKYFRNRHVIKHVNPLLTLLAMGGKTNAKKKLTLRGVTELVLLEDLKK